MIVWVDDGLFEGTARDVDLLALVRNAALHRHTLIVSAVPDAPYGARPSPHLEAWLAALTARLRADVALLRERTARVSASAVTRGATRLLICAKDPGSQHQGCRLSLEDAVRAVSQPLHILVEHQVNDAAFLRRVMPPVWRKRLEIWERRGELHFENGGGLTVMTTLVDFHSDDHNARAAFGLPTAIWRLVHFIVYDHDGDKPEQPGNHSRKLERSCKNADMVDHSHRLQRRDQEHYLPIESLREFVQSRVCDPTDRQRLLEEIDDHGSKGEERHFARLHDCFKNAFATKRDWPDEWFERDGAWAEMTRLAERIAAAI